MCLNVSLQERFPGMTITYALIQMLEKARIFGGWISGGIHGDVTRLDCPGGREDQPGTHYYKSQGYRARDFVGKEKNFQVEFLMEVKMWIAEDDLSCFS